MEVFLHVKCHISCLWFLYHPFMLFVSIYVFKVYIHVYTHTVNFGACAYRRKVNALNNGYALNNELHSVYHGIDSARLSMTTVIVSVNLLAPVWQTNK